MVLFLSSISRVACTEYSPSGRHAAPHTVISRDKGGRGPVRPRPGRLIPLPPSCGPHELLFSFPSLRCRHALRVRPSIRSTMLTWLSDIRFFVLIRYYVASSSAYHLSRVLSRRARKKAEPHANMGGRRC